MKHHNQKQIVAEKVYLAYVSTALFVKGNYNKKSEREGN